MTIVPGLATMSPATSAGPLFKQANVSWIVTRRMDAAESPARIAAARQHFAILQMAIDRKRQLRGGGRVGYDRCAVAAAQLVGRGDVVGVRVGQHDGGNAPAEVDEMINLAREMARLRRRRPAPGR